MLILISVPEELQTNSNNNPVFGFNFITAVVKFFVKVLICETR